jgi:hypothetical protein
MELCQVLNFGHCYHYHASHTDKDSSDPSSFDIYLVKMNSYPPINKLVAENVKTSDGSYTIDGLSADSGYVYFLRNTSSIY